MTTETNVPAPNKSIPDPKPRATPIPQGYDRILAGALKLPLLERASLTVTLDRANREEVDKLKQQSDAASKLLLNGGGS